jgi:hypothetical protein
MYINFGYNTGMDKLKIQAIYQELQGILSQAEPIGSRHSIDGKDCLPQLKSVILRLNEATEGNYDEYIPPTGSDGYVSLRDYRSKLAGLIARLHAEYTLISPQTIRDTPQTSISVNQSQSQSQYQTIMLDIYDSLGESLKNPNIKPEEKSFLDKLKALLRTTTDITSLLKAIFATATEFGLTIPVVAKLLGL